MFKGEAAAGCGGLAPLDATPEPSLGSTHTGTEAWGWETGGSVATPLKPRERTLAIDTEMSNEFTASPPRDPQETGSGHLSPGAQQHPRSVTQISKARPPPPCYLPSPWCGYNAEHTSGNAGDPSLLPLWVSCLQ